jgi:superfamily II DNA or RNA helicase
MLSELRPYQADGLEAIRQSIRGGVRRIVAQAATGAGKTKVAAAIVDGAMSKGNRTAFVVPAISLIDQTVESFWAEGIKDIGVIQANHTMTDWSKPVQVCSIQTLRARAAWPEARTVIFDEVHTLHEAHKAWLMDPAWSAVPFIGLSATPWTKGLGKYFDTLLVIATTGELIEQGYLSPFRVFATGHPDLSKVRTVAGDYHEGELSDAMQQGELTADIVRTWQEKWGKANTLCFGVDKAHAKTIQERFISAGISCGYQDADTTPDERRDIKRKFHNGEYRVVSNIQTLTTGVDWNVHCLILARPTKSEMLYVQIIGRALRTAPGKTEALILDHSDTTMRLGFVTDIHHEHLDTGTPADKAAARDAEKSAPPLPKECKSCGVLKPARVRICPNCGQAPKAESSVIERDGELVEVTGGKKQRAKTRKASDYSAPERQTFLSELKAHAIDRGYNPKWANATFREKFGEWPPRAWDTVAPAPAVSASTKSWVKSRQIAYSMAKATANHAG